MKVEKGIPIPIRKVPNKYNWGTLEAVGDSVLIPCNTTDKMRCQSIRAAAFYYGQRHGRKYVTRRVNNGVRVWRTK